MNSPPGRVSFPASAASLLHTVASESLIYLYPLARMYDPPSYDDFNHMAGFPSLLCATLCATLWALSYFRLHFLGRDDLAITQDFLSCYSQLFVTSWHLSLSRLVVPVLTLLMVLVARCPTMM